jgi:hypothetical protein
VPGEAEGAGVEPGAAGGCPPMHVRDILLAGDLAVGRAHAFGYPVEPAHHPRIHLRPDPDLLAVGHAIEHLVGVEVPAAAAEPVAAPAATTAAVSAHAAVSTHAAAGELRPCFGGPQEQDCQPRDQQEPGTHGDLPTDMAGPTAHAM